MGYVITIYSKEAFKEYTMPAINNSDYSIVLPKSYYNLRADVRIYFEIINGVWKLKKDKQYRAYEGNEILEERRIRRSVTLEDGGLFRIIPKDEKHIVLTVRKTETGLSTYQKFDLRRKSRITIGSNMFNDIQYNYQKWISGEHATITRNGRDYFINVAQKSNNLYINSRYCSSNTKLNFGDFINIYGLHLVFLGDILAVDINTPDVKINEKTMVPYTAPEGRTAETEEEAVQEKHYFHRSPRIIEKIEDEPIEIEEPTKEMKSQKKPVLMTIGPSFTMAIPMLMGSMMMIASARATGRSSSLFMYSGLIMAMSSAIIGVTWAIVNMRYQKKLEQEMEAHRFDAYSAYLVKKTEEIKEKYKHNQEALNLMYPSAARCSQYDEKNSNLWNRNATHEDFLSCRVGMGDIDFQAEIVIPKDRFRLEEDELAEKPGFILNNYKVLKNVPILLNLLEHNLIGIVGGQGKRGAFDVVRAMVAQIAACNSYTEVKMVFIYNDHDSDDIGQWEFARWLPHVWSQDKKIRYIASNKLEAGEVFYELTREFRQRLENAAEVPSDETVIPKPYYILFLSDPSLIEEEMIARYVFDASPEIGMTTVMLTTSNEFLPNACEYIVENDNNFRGVYNVSAQKEERTKVQFDDVNTARLEVFARTLSDIEVQDMETGGEIPNSLTFFDMYEIVYPEDLHAEERWLKNRNYDNIRGLIGQKSGGAPCYMDVHEKYHGPHGLVAGTTGSGKSETLQTYMLSLAINYSPDDIGFFIIDYKGGGMANLFDGLPHMIGQISNLSGNQIYRAMVSIKSENQRRQRLFNEYGVNNIDKYTKLYKNGETPTPIPHLFIIIDEFAELKREEPDFMTELISVARIGRSLGVHLILATQKPSGTVDDNIWTNSKFHLCLRVQDRTDSMDMLHKPDAAYITQAGRCYLQVGSDEVYELFQSGWSGAPYDPEVGNAKTEIAKLLTFNGKVELDGSHLHAHSKKSEDKLGTQLDAIKEYLRVTAEKNGYQKAHQLWMPLLPTQIYLEDFEEYRSRKFAAGQWKYQSGAWNLGVTVGLVDDPRNQRQIPLQLSFSEGGHHAIIGSVVSGKSTFVQTILYGLITTYSPEYVNIYGLDFSSKMMNAFKDSAHFGGVMFEDDEEKISKFFHMMEEILNERKKRYSGGNYSQYVQKNGIKDNPAILVAIDNFSAFKEKTEEKYMRFIIQLSKEGVNHGIFLLITAGGISMGELPNRVAENMKTMYCLELPDKFAYADIMHTTRIQVVPESGIKGRGLTTIDSGILEYQAALALEAEGDYQRMDKIEEVCAVLNQSWKGKRAQQIPEIPEKPTWDLFLETENVREALETDSLLPIGYDYSNAGIYSIDMRHMFCYLITGAVNTGKKNLMRNMIEASLLKQHDVCVIDGTSVMQKYAGRDGVRYVSNNDEFRKYMQFFAPEFYKRNAIKKQVIAAGAEEEELYQRTKKEKAIYVYIADLMWFFSVAEKPENSDLNVKGLLGPVLQKGKYHNIYFIGILNLEDKTNAKAMLLFNAFVGHKTGIHFGGNVSKNDIMNFDYLSYAEQQKMEKAGVGLLPVVDGEVTTKKVIVPLAGKKRKEE